MRKIALVVMMVLCAWACAIPSAAQPSYSTPSPTVAASQNAPARAINRLALASAWWPHRVIPNLKLCLASYRDGSRFAVVVVRCDYDVVIDDVSVTADGTGTISFEEPYAAMTVKITLNPNTGKFTVIPSWDMWLKKP